MSNHSIRRFHIGCAGWSVPREYAADFANEGTHLARYAGRFAAVEINSSFYKPHRESTYLRWAASVPKYFQFTVKMPKSITHESRLVNAEQLLERFLAEAAMLADKLGPILIQLPPSFSFLAPIAESFFKLLRQRFAGPVVLEPRHASWFISSAEDLLIKYQIARVAADPVTVPNAFTPGGWNGIAYYRFHGSPRVYYSSYSDDWLKTLSNTLLSCEETAEVWCIFDNTAAGAATANALKLLSLLKI